jgi:hypothetical protein
MIMVSARPYYAGGSDKAYYTLRKELNQGQDHHLTPLIRKFD